MRILILACAVLSGFASAQEFKAGFAKRDITPQKPMPMWGYGARHDALSVGVRDPLYAKCIVFDAGDKKLAVVTMDIGRGPTAVMITAIREAVVENGVAYVLISGSHTHHGPVIELLDAPEKGQGKFQDAVDYTMHLQVTLIDVIKEAASATQPAKIGWGSAAVAMNRNRHDKTDPKPIDTEMSVVRVDGANGTPIALLVNYHAHPTRLPADDLRYSAEWPGEMMKNVESKFGAPCMFVQGAAGDLTTQSTEETKTLEAFGAAIAGEALKINETITTAVPVAPSIKGIDNEFSYPTRSDISSPASQKLLKGAFFPELVNAFMTEMGDKQIHPQLTSILLNGEIFWVGVSGEYFCSHSLHLKERAEGVKVIFQGYCNGHHMYFPTIEGASQGGYGADASVSWVPLGAGEDIMDQALINLYKMQEKF
ncbi:MAG: hypothetical protein SGI88_05385 [Candidatus Hydrogenedentes bacterium]|nr:hypothetical protein [Candidatus Hydrogenedentota bacterium]